MKNFDKIGIKPCDILIPKQGADYEKWSVVACDQYTSQPEYWEKAAALAAGAPSTLNIIFPEVYLEDGDGDARIANINRTMADYLANDVFQTVTNSFILVNRSFSDGKSRKGLVAAVDLECYDYKKGAKSLIRATEGTVLERIPPRVKIRANAPLELPHIMILIDDPAKTVIEPLFEKSLPQLYDFDLMQESGHITGYQVSDDASFDSIASALEALCVGENPFLYAMGDGNHSLASAKAHWENVKQTLTREERLTHPARFALAELVNVHDDGLVFEPIHRICTDVDPVELLTDMKAYFSKTQTDGAGQKVTYLYNGIRSEFDMGKGTHSLTVGSLQEFLDWKMQQSSMKIDYIHGEDVVASLSAQPNAIGFLLPGMDKSQLFPSVAASGVLPRKTFSMGEAYEKRFYLECRKITK